MSELLLGVGAFVTFEEDVPGEPPNLVLRVGFDEHRLVAGDDAIAWRMLSRHPRSLDSLVGELYQTDEVGAHVAVDADTVAQAINRLRGSGLVIGVDPDDDQLARIALATAIVPLYRAVTEGVEAATGTAIGTRATTVCRLTAAQQALWAELDDARSVAHLAVARSVAVGGNPTEADMAAAFDECIELVRAGAAYFDAAVF